MLIRVLIYTLRTFPSDQVLYTYQYQGEPSIKPGISKHLSGRASSRCKVGLVIDWEDADLSSSCNPISNLKLNPTEECVMCIRSVLPVYIWSWQVDEFNLYLWLSPCLTPLTSLNQYPDQSQARWLELPPSDGLGYTALLLFTVLHCTTIPDS